MGPGLQKIWVILACCSLLYAPLSHSHLTEQSPASDAVCRFSFCLLAIDFLLSFPFSSMKTLSSFLFPGSRNLHLVLLGKQIWIMPLGWQWRCWFQFVSNKLSSEEQWCSAVQPKERLLTGENTWRRGGHPCSACHSVMFHVRESAAVLIHPSMFEFLRACANDFPSLCVCASVYLFVLLPAAHLRSEPSCF